MLYHEAMPVEDVYIRIYRMDHKRILYEDFFTSDALGSSMKIPLYCDENKPYTIYQIDIRKQHYQTLRFHNIEVFENISSTLYVEMLPEYGEDKHTLTYDTGSHTHMSEKPSPTFTPKNKGVRTSMLREVVIPTTITVHLGRPDRNAENLTVPFIYYLKNVASSEIYPTWPTEALKANIWAQISLVLNRVFTEWYPSQGYNFDITNSTAYDQAFVKNRIIYDNIAAIVDEVFNEYIKKRNFEEPFYAEYCDGKIAQCPGMKQWGTLDLANRGFDALSILRYYYGDSINIVSSDNISPIQLSYPGTPLRRGDAGPVVRAIQAQLNAIAINYPNIRPIFPVDGIFGAATEAAVRVFQRQFNLTDDGVVGKVTYYKISFVYVAVRKLAELGTLGHLPNLYSGAWPQVVLREGDRGIETQLMQYYLSSISLFYPEIPNVNIDGRFGSGTENAVLAFQRRFGLAVDGLVGQSTWDRIYVVYTSIAEQLPDISQIPPYPGFTLQIGSVGEDVAQIQSALLILRTQYPSIPLIASDGIFGPGTRDAVIRFQELFNLTPDGIVGQATWQRLFTAAAQIETTQFDNDIMMIGNIQQQLQNVANVYPSISPVTQNNEYDQETHDSIASFQRMMGLNDTGDLDKTTLQVLNEIDHEIKTM